nr:hypothetical protein CFP56_41785 [Quercus suber]
MESAIDSEFQHEICESGLSNIDRQGANGELDDDGKPKRTEFQHEICESGLSNIDRQGANGELDDDGKPKRTGNVSLSL